MIPIRKTAAILGLGPTLEKFDPVEGLTTIGVNDIFRRRPVDHLLVMDQPPGEWIPCLDTLERLKKEGRADIWNIIAFSSPRLGSWSQLEIWADVLPRFNLIQVIPPIAGIALVDKLDGDALPSGQDSPFTAAVLAYRLGFKRIVIYGADYNNHTLTNDRQRLDEILMSWELLKINLKIRGVILETYSRQSRLSLVLPWIVR